MPLPYQPENNDIPVKTPPTGFDALRTIAVSRIYLDNFDHITAYWVGMGMKLAQVALSYGADDLHGTIIEEHIFHMAGATSPQLQTEADMVKAIREAGRTPVQRNTFYEPIKVWEEICPPTATPAPTRVKHPSCSRETSPRPDSPSLRLASERLSVSPPDVYRSRRRSPHADPIVERCPAELAARHHQAREKTSSSPLAPFRVGSVNALNAVPLTRGLEDEVVFATPAKLAEMLRRDELDAGLVSVVEPLFTDRYDILDGVAMAALGEVKSVHRRPSPTARRDARGVLRPGFADQRATAQGAAGRARHQARV